MGRRSEGRRRSPAATSPLRRGASPARLARLSLPSRPVRRTAFNEYQLCVEKRGRGDLLCLQRGRDYSTVCPEKWVEDWKDQTEAGVNMSVGNAFIRAE